MTHITPIPSDADRIATLRRRCLRAKPWPIWWDPVTMARSLRESEGVGSWQLRRGLLTGDRLAALPFDLDDRELLMGRLGPPADLADSVRKEAEEYLKRYEWPGGQSGHCALDMTHLFALGIDGLAAEIEALRGQAAGETADVYQSFLYALDGFGRMIENAARTAEEVLLALESNLRGGSPDPPRHLAPSDRGVAFCRGGSGDPPREDAARREELREMAASCRWIAHGPPETFRDAIQLVWFAEFGTMLCDDAHLVAPGRLDRILGPYYEADLAKGRITRERALLLIESLYLLVNETVVDGLAMPVMVGGRDAAGHDVTSDLSYLCLEALRRTKLIYPTVGVSWHPGTPPALVDLAIELIGQGYATPAFFNDETIQRGLLGLGVPPEEACNYINSTCVEITPVGGSAVWVASPYYPTCAILLEEIAAEAAGGAAPTFEAFLDRYRARLSRAVAAGADEQNALRRQRARWGGKPLQSVLTRDCLARGLDIERGGARYNWVECSFVGLANLADSLEAIRQEVYVARHMTLADLKAVLDTDFRGHEAARERFPGSHAKYGNGDPAVDGLFADLVRFVAAECAKHRMEPDGSPFVPGAFAWTMHEFLGRQCGATPDGRRAGTPFADGCGPAQGRESRGPTAAILSTTSWDHAPMIGGLAYNMKFSSALLAGPESLARLRDLVLTFLRRGGFETQINVVSRATLARARTHPDEHRDLVVRVGGYTDYFTRLSPEMQDEIMLRTEYAEV